MDPRFKDCGALSTILAYSAFGESLGCIAAKATFWYWLTEAHVEALHASGAIKDKAACHNAVNAGGTLADQIIPTGFSGPADLAKDISNCACDDTFSSDGRLHPTADYPGPLNVVAPGSPPVFVMTALGNECWNYNNGSKDLQVILSNQGTCPQVGQQVVSIELVGAGPWYQLRISGNHCVNVDESSWNQTGPGIIHFLPCSNGAAANDIWAVLRNPDPKIFQYVFKSKRSAGCLDLRSQDDVKSARVQQNFCNGTANEYWTFSR